MTRLKSLHKDSRRRVSPSVFINCPFDSSYKPLFDAIVFAVLALGFDVQSALGRDTGTEERLSKILRMIGNCQFGIHDLSFMRIDRKTRLPRYNMVFELGLFLGCCEYGSSQQAGKSCLILDRERWRYRKSISDLSGRDIRAHEGKPLKAIPIVRDWLATESKPELPGGQFVVEQYRRFQRQLPRLCQKVRRQVITLTFSDYCEMVREWLRMNA